MTQYAPGWYLDPSGSGHQRWFDGAMWTATTAPTPVAAPTDSPQFWTAPPAWSAQPSPQPQAPQPNQQWDDLMSRHAAPPPSTSLLTRNRYTAITAGIAALYLVLAVAAHIALIGILPVVMSRRAFRAKEPLAIASAVIAGICLVLALASLIR